MKKITIKETGENTFLIYVKHGEINIECELAKNKKEKTLAVNTFLLKHFPDCTKYDIKDIVEEITL